jgi:copper chaperone CopZ
MFRRDFIQRLTVAGASGLAIIKNTEAMGVTTVTCKVKGFSCITCAVGLEVMLREQRGIARAEASYPDGTLVVGFDPDLISESSLLEFIKSKGFMAEKKTE